MHVHELCQNVKNCKEEKCTQRHPKTCKTFKDKGKCRFDSDCAYLHEEDSQNRLNEVISHCMIKHEKEISDLKEEVKTHQEVIRVMTEKIKNLEESLKDYNKSEQITDIFEETEDMLKCKDCKYECKKETTMKKHQDSNHPKQTKDHKETQVNSDKGKKVKFFCDQCDFSCLSKKSLKKHISQGHEVQNPMSQWMCNNCGHQCISKDVMKDHINENHIEDSNKSESDFHEAPEVDEAELDEWIAEAAKAAKAAEN
jgi:hypothetical protein